MSRAQNQELRGLDKIPLATKFLLTIPFTIFIIDRIFGLEIRRFMADFPYNVIYKHEFQRLFLAQFAEDNLYAFFVCPVILFFFMREIEQKIGTVAILIDYLYKGLLIQLVYTFLSYLFLPLEPYTKDSKEIVVNYGCSILIVFYSASNACVNPKQNATFLGIFCYTIWAICEVPVLIFVSHLAQQLNSIEIIASLIAAFIDVFILSHVISRPIQACAKLLEICCVFRIFQNRKDYYFSRPDSLSQIQTNIFQQSGVTGVKIGSDENVEAGTEL